MPGKKISIYSVEILTSLYTKKKRYANSSIFRQVVQMYK